MPAGRKISEHIDEFNKIVLDLENIYVNFEDKDLALLLLTSLPASYEQFMDTLLYRREALTLKDVMATLNSKEIKEKSKAKGDDGEGLYVRGRTDHGDSRYIKKDEQPSSSGSNYDDSEVMMNAMRGSVQLGDNRECKIRGIGKVRIQLKDGLSFVLHNVRDNCVWSLDDHEMAGELNASVEEKDSLAQEFEQLCIKSRVARHLTVIGMPQQNGLVERMNKTLMDKVRCLLIQSRLPRTFWAEATYTAAYLINRNVVFNESVMYKDTLKDSGARADKSVEVELQRLNNHTPEEDQTDQEDGDDRDAGDEETDQIPDLTDYRLARDRERRTRTKTLRFQDENNMAAYAF
nr:retrovirus-related Pol polyprotein from transposon TNT 1-94 [Tanacetum cinerariifolium]